MQLIYLTKPSAFTGFMCLCLAMALPACAVRVTAKQYLYGDGSKPEGGRADHAPEDFDIAEDRKGKQ